jgi:hypothetical protein
MAQVFVSHRGSDAATAARVKADLASMGHAVWLDADEIRAGDSIVQRMNEGLEVATHVVVLYSDDTTPGRWFDAEWMSALARLLDGHSIRLVPARIGISRGPAILADIAYADLATNWVNGMKRLAAALV